MTFDKGEQLSLTDSMFDDVLQTNVGRLEYSCAWKSCQDNRGKDTTTRTISWHIDQKHVRKLLLDIFSEFLASMNRIAVKEEDGLLIWISAWHG